MDSSQSKNGGAPPPSSRALAAKMRRELEAALEIQEGEEGADDIIPSIE
jgi:hypothetical protein